MSCHLWLGDPVFSAEEVERTIRDKGLLSLEIGLDRSDGPAQGQPGQRDLGADELCSVIAQARELGARELIVHGGEPMLTPHVLVALRYGREQGLRVELVTNGCRIDRAAAERLFELGVRVVLKRSSLVPEVQDQLAGLEGAHQLIETAYRNLRDAGYPSGDRVLGISSLICRENASELPRLWEWIRREGLVPYLDVILPHEGNASRGQTALAPEDLQELIERLAAWDRAHGGGSWDPQPPSVGCLRHLFSCLVDAEGRVLPCAGVAIPVGDVRQRPLREILEDSEVMQNLRDHTRTIAGPCAVCSRSDGCHGCRGSAYGETGDYLASDPRCRLNRDRQHEIARMPLAAAPLIPQRDPMRLVDTLRSVGERVATAGVTVRAEMPFVDGDGLLCEAAYLEMMAQAAAAMGGFNKRGKGGWHEEGLMLGVRNLEILGEARVGDELEIEVFKSARLGEFGIIEGCVRRQADVLARGEIKVLQLGPRVAS